MAADFILDTASINRHVEAILPRAGMISSHRAPRVNITGHTNTKHRCYITLKDSLPKRTVSSEVILAALARLEPLHQTVVTYTGEKGHI